MGFRDCLLSALSQGDITKQEADDLLRRFDEEYAQARLSLGDDAAAGAAKAKLEKDLRAEHFEARRRAMLQIAAQDRLAEYFAGFRNVHGRADIFEAALNKIENYGFAGTSSIAGRSKAIVSLVHGELSDMLLTFRRSQVTGARLNQAAIADVVRESLGEATGKPEAKAMADALQNVFEALRQRFNAAGGAIGKIEGGYLPQKHDPRALLAAGREEWKTFTKPLLDMQRMRDPLTAEQLTPARLDQVLDAAFDQVTTDGWIRAKPSGQPAGNGALATSRAEHRFLHFKDADSWSKYNEQFGSGDPMKAVFNHINGMAKDIAVLEEFGPNPNSTVEWMKQLVQAEAAKTIAGRPSLYDAGSKTSAWIFDKLNYAPWRIDAVYQYVRGRNIVSGSIAAGFANTRNVLSSALLGSASVLAATTDPFIDAAARKMSGLPVAKALWGILDAFRQTATREKAVRSGIILDDFLHITGDEARYAGELSGSGWSRALAERTMNWSGLQPITQARKHVFALDFQAAMADHAEIAFDELPHYLKRTMEGYGLGRTEWDVIRATAPHTPGGGAGFIRPIDVAALGQGPALPKVQKLLGIDAQDADAAAEQTARGVRHIAEKYLEMILQQTERAVPEGTARARSVVTGLAPRGSVFGEIIESGLQFKSFALSFTTLQWQTIAQEGGLGSARGAAYASSLGIMLALGGGAALQLKNMANGKDMQPMNDPRFWIQALQTGGGIGLMGDFLFADVNRMNHSLGTQLLGPTVGLATDIIKGTAGNTQEAAQGKPTHVGREAVQFAGRYTPVMGSMFYLRTAYRRVFLDQLQYLADPDAHRNFREQQQRLYRETKQDFWWRPGQAVPDRLPRLAN